MLFAIVTGIMSHLSDDSDWQSQAMSAGPRPATPPADHIIMVESEPGKPEAQIIHHPRIDAGIRRPRRVRVSGISPARPRPGQVAGRAAAVFS